MIKILILQIPEHLWAALVEKLRTETFDAGSYFRLDSYCNQISSN